MEEDNDRGKRLFWKWFNYEPSVPDEPLRIEELKQGIKKAFDKGDISKEEYDKWCEMLDNPNFKKFIKDDS